MRSEKQLGLGEGLGRSCGIFQLLQVLCFTLSEIRGHCRVEQENDMSFKIITLASVWRKTTGGKGGSRRLERRLSYRGSKWSSVPLGPSQTLPSCSALSPGPHLASDSIYMPPVPKPNSLVPTFLLTFSHIYPFVYLAATQYIQIY